MPGLSHAHSQRDSARSALAHSRADLTTQRTALETTTKQLDAAKLAQHGCVSLADDVDHLSAMWTKFVAAEIKYDATQPGSAAEQQAQVELTRQVADLGVAVAGAVGAAAACRKSVGWSLGSDRRTAALHFSAPRGRCHPHPPNAWRRG